MTELRQGKTDLVPVFELGPEGLGCRQSGLRLIC